MQEAEASLRDTLARAGAGIPPDAVLRPPPLRHSPTCVSAAIAPAIAPAATPLGAVVEDDDGSKHGVGAGANSQHSCAHPCTSSSEPTPAPTQHRATNSPVHVASSSRQAGDASGYCGRFGLLLSMPILPRILLVGACWLAVSLLYYGLSFAIGACDPDKGCNPYPRGALLALVDVPGNVLAFYLADLPRFGRRTTTAMAFLLGGLCLLLSPLATRYAPPAAHLTLALALIGKTCAAAAFLLVYLFPTELFPTTVRASALGICNIFARAGTMAAPLAANVPPEATQLVLGSAAVVAGLLALMLPETRGKPMGGDAADS